MVEIKQKLNEDIGENYHRVTKVKVSHKCLTFVVDTNNHLTKFTFRKRTTGGLDTFGFSIEERRPVVKKKTCNLGHEHVVDEKIALKEYAHMEIGWEQAESLMGWFATGTWRQVREGREEL
jgi:hypothetical protein